LRWSQQKKPSARGIFGLCMDYEEPRCLRRSLLTVYWGVSAVYSGFTRELTVQEDDEERARKNKQKSGLVRLN
jgi:hypothetical protein